MTKSLIIIGSGSSKSIHESFPTGIELAHFVDVHLITTKKARNDPNYGINCPYISAMLNESLLVFKHDVEYLDSLIDQLKIKLWAYARKYEYYSYRTGAEPISIDSLISSEFKDVPDVYNLAKQCLAYHLKGQEDAYYDKIKETSIWNDAWVENIYTTLKSRGINLNDITNNLKVISFNYERLFEYLSYRAINKVFNESISELPFLEYIYGNFGNLNDVPFNALNNSEVFRNHCYRKIKLIGERHSVSKVELDNYEKVLFIGFGYDKDNLIDTLRVQNVKSAKLIGMCTNKRVFHEDIERAFKIKINRFDKIEDFINTYL